MSVKADLEQIVTLQKRELELERIGRDLDAIERERAALHAEIEAAEEAVSTAETELQTSGSERKRLELDLQTAEGKVEKYKEQVMAVRKNEELWALQKEIDAAEEEAGSVETRILEHMETADWLHAVIAERGAELEETRKRAGVANAEADRRAAELDAEAATVGEAIAGARGRLPDDLLRKYEKVKKLRGGVAVAEAQDEVCLSCNVKLRPQLYVETLNLSGIMQCENCHRILYVAEPLDLPGGAASGRSEAEVAPEAPAEATT